MTHITSTGGNFVFQQLRDKILSHNVTIRINAAAFIKFLALKMRCLFEGGVYLREAFIANLVTTTVNLLCHLNVNLTNTINPQITKN